MNSPSNPLPVVKKKNAATEALVGLFTVVLSAAVVAALFFARELLIPLALAALLTFVLAPLVTWIERFIGRTAAVSIVALLVFSSLGAMGWVVTRQAFDVATQLPGYRSNIENKFHGLKLSDDGPFNRLSRMVSELEAELPVFGSALPVESKNARASGSANSPASSANQSTAASPFNKLQVVFMPFFSVAATGGIVIVLVIFMLLKREDLRGRLIKLIGQGRISWTSRAMEDAAARVSRYLITQLVVNIVFGTVFALGLTLIGLPNAILWGAMAVVLRFIPYVGVWLAAICPILLAMAVSPDWLMLLETLGLFGALEMATSNLIEPLLYRSSTGVSSLALIVAAIFWTWLWGPMGLLLSTPLTVCLAVIGRHVPRLSFFSILLGTEEALSPAEECYHRLLVGSLNEAGKVVDTYLGDNSLTALYDSVLLPALTMAEVDFDREELEEEQRTRVLQGMRDMMNDLSSRPMPPSQIEADKSIASESMDIFPKSDCRVVCVSAKGERDDVAGTMLVHLLSQQGFNANTASPGASLPQLLALIDEYHADAVCVSVVPPTTLIHARHLSAQLHTRLPKLKIIVGIWGATENLEAAIKGLQLSGATEVVVSLAEAVVQLSKLSTSLLETALPASVRPDESSRVEALLNLKQYRMTTNPELDRMTKKLTRTFKVPIALITLIDQDKQHFKSQTGLPGEIAGICDIPRGDSVCNHVVAADALLVVEDLYRDRRFANNSLLKKNNFRFYAGYPIHAPNGQPVGAICLLDTRPRTFSESDRRLLAVLADEVSDTLVVDSSHAEVLA